MKRVSTYSEQDRANVAVSGYPPPSVLAAFRLWMVALVAGVFETSLAVLAIAVGRDDVGLAAAFGQVAVRMAASTGLFVLARAMRSGRSWARWALAAVFGVLGTFSLLVGPIASLGSGGLSSAAYAVTDLWQIAFTTSRAVHLLSVWAAVISMFSASANRFFTSRRARSADPATIDRR